MLYIMRTTANHLALARTNDDDGELVLMTGKKIGLPETAFFNVLRAKGLEDEMIAENPDRWARVQANGVGQLRQEKGVLTRSGLSRANAHTKNPDPGTFEDLT